MQYILITVTNNSVPGQSVNCYQEISGGQLISYKDLDGNPFDMETIYGPGAASSYVIDPNPPFPVWGIPD